ncbi:MAG: methyltransferase domain-containing protein [Steroidobacteraceae bacterium]|jgi:SAM-dependent methyltransferase
MANPESAPAQPTASIASGYDAIAEEYVRHVFHELDGKPFDRDFLERFAASCPKDGLVLDLGCGPGHIGRYLARRGVRVCGLDISPRMVDLARQLNPGTNVLLGDMRSLPFERAAVAAIVAFYSIIHLPAAELRGVFDELFRVLQPGGTLALAFHVGDEVVHVEQLWGVKTSIDFQFFDPRGVRGALTAAGFELLECTEREPYASPIEAQTRRCYLLARALAEFSTGAG